VSTLLDLGHMSYGRAYEVQTAIANRVKSGELKHVLLFVEHDAVLTLGANFHEENLLLTPEQYRERGIDVERTDRGGDVTFHGPRQLVIYPIFDISMVGKDLHKWLRDLEETIILVLAELGLQGYRFSPNTGVWVNHRKVAAIGIKVSRWVSMHGIALNCENDLSPFGLIVPCGIRDFGVTSLSKETGRRITIEEAKPMVLRAFERVFGMSFETASLSDLTDGKFLDAFGEQASPKAG
jgi:lipoyl(octanoyl) transferase